MGSKLTAITGTIALISCAAAAPAAAQAPGQTTGGPAPGATAPGDDLRTYSTGAAFGLSLLGTTAGVALGVKLASERNDGLALLAFSIGPSLGHMYVRSHKAAWLAASARLAGVLLIAYGLDSVPNCYDDCYGPRAPVLSLVGGVTVVGATLYSLFGPVATADSKNKRVTRSKRGQRRYMPMMMRAPGGSQALGFGMAAQF